ncbi:hypothetical protein J2Z50_003025 [Ensifer mexicanus]|nr:hypothetical protein [Sinorhizobium mexicanum]
MRTSKDNVKTLNVAILSSQFAILSSLKKLLKKYFAEALLNSILEAINLPSSLY